MIFSLQKKFFLFLLVPVVLILLITGLVSFFYARKYLLEQWQSWALLRLERSADQIRVDLNEKRELMGLVAEAESVPDAYVTQAFLMQKLKNRKGVSFVDLQTVPGAPRQTRGERAVTTAKRASDGSSGNGYPDSTMMPMRHMHRMNRGHPSPHKGMEGMESMMPHHVRPVWMGTSHEVSFLEMTEGFPGREPWTEKRLTVQVSFDSIMDQVWQIGRLEGSYACLVTSDGTYLAHTDRSMYRLKKLGASGDPIEQEVLRRIKTEDKGTIFGKGYPPEKVVCFFKVHTGKDSGGSAKGPADNWYLILYSRGDVILRPILKFRSTYALAGFACVILISILIRRNTQPVAQTIANFGKVASEVERGDFTARLSEDRADEIGQLKKQFNQMVAGLEKRALIEETFGRYVDKTVAQELMENPEALHLGGVTRVVTVLMCDLRGFTRLSEALRPEQVIHLINRHFSGMIRIIEEHRGIIVDFYGDSILAFFDGFASNNADRALDAVKCALEMQEEVKRTSLKNREEGLPAIAMGIGVHTGEVVVGNIGSEARAKYGIVGSAVNETDRIQSQAESGSILISESTRELLDHRIVVQSKHRTDLKGLQGPRDLYSVRALSPDPGAS